MQKSDLSPADSPGTPAPLPSDGAGACRAARKHRPATDLRIPTGTILKIFAALLIGAALFKLWPLLLLVFLALFLAVTLNAFVQWLENKGLPHWGSLTVVIASLLAVLGAGLALLIPALLEQTSHIGENFPKLRDDVLQHLPVSDSLRQDIRQTINNYDWSQAGSWMGHLWSAGGAALAGISQTALILVIALYLLVDGRKIYDWFLAFFSPLYRSKLRITSKEISLVIFGYVSGQVITSVLVTIYAYIVLTMLHVPAALMLAILAGIMDVLPVLGFVIATIPALLLGLTVSPQTGFLVLLLYVVFHGIETYVIIPRVYGKSLRVSTLTVLLGLLAGSVLAGIPGALAALPVIASYAAIERIWLKPYLREGVAEKHELQKVEEFGDKK